MLGTAKRLSKLLLRGLGYEICRVQSPASVVMNDTVQRLDPETAQLLLSSHVDSPFKLHIGCGARILRGWINIDLKYVHFGDYLRFYGDQYYPLELRGDRSDFFVFDLSEAPLPLPDNSVDVIFHEDFIEHLTQRSQVLFLAETCRILKPGAIHRVNTPNLLSSMREHSDFKRGFEGVYVEEWDRWSHRSILTPRLLEDLALTCGYQKVIFNGRDRSVSPLIPPEYRPDPKDRPEDGNIFADLVK